MRLPTSAGLRAPSPKEAMKPANIGLMLWSQFIKSLPTHLLLLLPKCIENFLWPQNVFTK